MKKILSFFIIVYIIFAQSCQTPETRDFSTAADNIKAFELLKQSRFREANDVSGKRLSKIKNDPNALAINIISAYFLAICDINSSFRKYRDDIPLNFVKDLYSTFERAEKNFTEIDRNLEILSEYENFSFDFCPGDIQIDWDENGEIENSEKNMFAIETDKDGNRIIPQKPVFRFDHSDVLWAQSYINFHLAYVSMLSSFDYSDILSLMKTFTISDRNDSLTIRIRKKEGLINARDYMLKGLGISRKSREAILSETDDEREWVPNPSQADCPMPLPVDHDLFESWVFYLDCLEDLFNGKTVLGFNSLLEKGKGISGGVDIKKLFTEPNDIHLNYKTLEEKIEEAELTGNVDPLMEEIFGKFYVYDRPFSPITDRFAEMKNSVDTRTDTFGRKFKYLLWIN